MKKNTTYSEHPNRASRAAHERAKTQYPTYDTSLIKPKKSKKPTIVVLVAVALAIIAFVAVAIFACGGCSKTLATGKTAEVTIEEGSSTWTIADKMAEAGVVDNTWVFRATVVEMGAEASLKPGHYIFEGGKSVREYVQILCDGPDSNAPKVVVTEGMRLRDIASAVEKTTNGRISSSDFIEATSNSSVYVNDYPFLKDAGTNHLEGFLFPKTYPISNKDSVNDIVKMMLDQFKKEIDNLNFDYPNSLNYNIYEVVTLASIVEKESIPGMYGKVASVFYNRINNGMYVNSDATTAYELGHDPSAEEVHANTPYSTYTNFGLPPTPICSPGFDSLKAVCEPEKTNYFFFVFKRDANGEMKYRFSETFDQHQEAIVELGLV